MDPPVSSGGSAPEAGPGVAPAPTAAVPSVAKAVPPPVPAAAPPVPPRDIEPRAKLFAASHVLRVSKKPNEDAKLLWSVPALPDAASITLLCFPVANATVPASVELFSFTQTLSDGLHRHGYCAYVPDGKGVECVCIVSDFWCPALFDGVLQEFVKSAYHSKGVALEQRDLLLRSFAEAITRVVFPKPGEVLRLPVGTDTDMVFEHPATRHHTIDVDDMGPVLALPNEVVILMISELLAQSNIIFVAPLAQLNNVIRSFLVLLAPFDWQLSLIPVLPDRLMEMCEAPMPYIVGITPLQYPQIEARCKAGTMEVANLTVFNYEAKTVKPDRERRLRGQLPEVVVSTISSALDEARKAYKASPVATSKHLQVQIAGLWSELFAAPALKVVDAHLDAAFPTNAVIASAPESRRALLAAVYDSQAFQQWWLAQQHLAHQRRRVASRVKPASSDLPDLRAKLVKLEEEFGGKAAFACAALREFQEVLRLQVAASVAAEERVQAGLEKAKSELARMQQQADHARLVDGRANAVDEATQKHRDELNRLRELQRMWDAIATAAARLLEFSAALRADAFQSAAYTLLDRKRQVEALWRAWKQASGLDITNAVRSIPRIDRLVSPAVLSTIMGFAPLPHQHLHNWLAAFKAARDSAHANVASGAGVWQTARWLESLLAELYPDCVIKGGVLTVMHVTRTIWGGHTTFGKGNVALSNVALHSSNTPLKAFVLCWESGADKHQFVLQPNTQVCTVQQESGEKGQWELRLINVAGQSEVHLAGRGMGLYKWTQCCEAVVRAAARAQTTPPAWEEALSKSSLGLPAFLKLIGKDPAQSVWRNRDNLMPLHLLLDLAIPVSLADLKAAITQLLSIDSTVLQQLMWHGDDGRLVIHRLSRFGATLSADQFADWLEVLYAVLGIGRGAHIGELLTRASHGRRNNLLHYLATEWRFDNTTALLQLLEQLRAMAPSAFDSALGALNAFGDTPLHLLLRNSRLDFNLLALVEFVVAIHPQSAQVANQGGFVPLHYAAEHKYGGLCVDLLAFRTPSAEDASLREEDWHMQQAMAVKCQTGHTPYVLSERLNRAAFDGWIRRQEPAYRRRLVARLTPKRHLFVLVDQDAEVADAPPAGSEAPKPPPRHQPPPPAHASQAGDANTVVAAAAGVTEQPAVTANAAGASVAASAAPIGAASQPPPPPPPKLPAPPAPVVCGIESVAAAQHSDNPLLAALSGGRDRLRVAAPATVVPISSVALRMHERLSERFRKIAKQSPLNRQSELRLLRVKAAHHGLDKELIASLERALPSLAPNTALPEGVDLAELCMQHFTAQVLADPDARMLIAFTVYEATCPDAGAEEEEGEEQNEDWVD